MYLANGRAGVVNLDTLEISELELDEDSLLSGDAISIAEELLSNSGGDGFVLGSGILTASLIPAACAGFVLGTPKDNAKRIAPLLGHAGAEFKLSGFDFLVVKGRASEPGYLWARDGMIEFVRAPEIKNFDSWGRTDKIRDSQGDKRIQVLSVGPWGDAGFDASQFVVDYWGGEDKSGLASELGRRNLLAIAFRGMGEFEVSDSEGHLKACLRIQAEQMARMGRSFGIESYDAAFAREDFRQLVHRPIACFGCLFPCRSFLKIHEGPKVMEHFHKEPGYLHYDIPALHKALESGMSVREATEVLIKCARAGVEPVSVIAEFMRSNGKAPPSSLDPLLGQGHDVQRAGEADLRGGFARSFGDGQSYMKCLGLGLCPRYWAKAGLDITAISECAEPAIGVPLKT
jgi:hypothetical protein